MAPQFTSVPTKYAVRPLLAAPCPVMLPVLLTNIIPETFPLPIMLTDIDASRALTPPPHRAPTPPRRATPPHCATPPHRAPTPANPLESEGSDSDSSRSAKEPAIARPSGANIQTVKSLFKDRYSDLTQQEHDKKYTDFRSHLDGLCTQYLRPSVALTYQDKDDCDKVYNKMTAAFPWLAYYDKHWPVSVCLQGKLHNSAARAVEKSTRKVVNIIAGVAPSKTKKKVKR
ncbi:hypothetical protein B0H19DRAFT_1264976 [Mycena capillaripes]|nr:hypothetical protein B0H19DRAFT_1264976 [Mycena capillaripes]